MKLSLLLPLLLSVIPSVKADSVCVLTSEVEPDVNITLKYTGSGGGLGTINSVSYTHLTLPTILLV